MVALLSITNTMPNAMKPIETNFRSKGFDYHQVYRDGLWCIYRQTKPKTDIERFEVIKLHADKQSERFGAVIPAHERYPSPQEWGKRGWTCLTLADAKVRLHRNTALSMHV